MREEEKFLRGKIGEMKDKIQNLTEEAFDNKIDYHFQKSVFEGELSAYQNVMVNHTKMVNESSEEEAAIMMHQYLKKLSDTHRLELSNVEKSENQEDEKITTDRGRLNGLIDGYNNSRLYFDSMTSEHAARRERSAKK